MDLANQANDMMMNSLRAQQQLWTSWLETIQGMQPRSATSPWQQFTERQLQVWETQTKSLMDQMQGILHTQSTWINQPQNNPWNHLPALTESWTRQIQLLAENGAKANQQIVEGYIEASKHLDVTKVMSIWNVTLEQSMKAGEETLQKVMEAELALLPTGEQKPAPEKKKATG